MDTVERIQERFKAGATTVEVTVWEWAKHRAEMNSLDRVDDAKSKLEIWADWNGYGYRFDIARNVHVLFKL